MATDDAPTLEIKNEFASIRVSIDQTGNGTRLKITDPDMDLTVLVDPTLLRGLLFLLAVPGRHSDLCVLPLPASGH